MSENCIPTDKTPMTLQRLEGGAEDMLDSFMQRIFAGGFGTSEDVRMLGMRRAKNLNFGGLAFNDCEETISRGQIVGPCSELGEVTRRIVEAHAQRIGILYSPVQISSPICLPVTRPGNCPLGFSIPLRILPFQHVSSIQSKLAEEDRKPYCGAGRRIAARNNWNPLGAPFAVGLKED